MQAFSPQKAHVCRTAALPGLSTAKAACQGLRAVHFTLDKLRTMAVAGQCKGRSRNSGKIGKFTIFWTVNCGKFCAGGEKFGLFAPGRGFVLCDFSGTGRQIGLALPESPAGTAGGGRRGEATGNRAVAAMDEGIKIAPLPKQRGYCQSTGLTAFAAAGNRPRGNILAHPAGKCKHKFLRCKPPNRPRAPGVPSGDGGRGAQGRS